MPNVSGSTYGLTILSPIIEDNHPARQQSGAWSIQGGDCQAPARALPGDFSEGICHSMQLRWYLSQLPRDHRSPFAQISSTYLARLVVLDDVVYVGLPACEDHLKSRYLIFETNFDGDLDTYLGRMATETSEFVNDVWKHCVGFPGTDDINAFIAYMKKCQIETTFFFADVNDRTVETTLEALKTQSALARFMEHCQGIPPAELQHAFGEFLKRLRNSPPLPRGGGEHRHIPQEQRPHG